MVTQNTVFDMAQLGRRIATYRKKLNLTQGLLAEELGVSHQAISSWENGLTSPDISKLTDLSRIFEISIDDLLDNKRIATIIHKIDAVETLEEDDIVDIASMIKPVQLEKILDDSEANSFSLDSIIHILPFIGDEFLGGWMARNSEHLSLKDVSPMLPFLNYDQIEILLRRHKDTSIEDLTPLLPFLNTDQISELIKTEKAKEGFSINGILSLAPFMSESQIREAIAHQPITSITMMAPFIDESTLDEITKQAISDQKFKEISELAPFLSESTLNFCIDTFINEKMLDESMITGLLPFLEQNQVLKLFNYLVEHKMSANSIKMFL